MLLKTLVKAGIKSSRWSFVGIFLLMLLTSAVVSTTISLYIDLNAREGEALEQVGAGDVFACDSSEAITQDVIAEIEAIEEVGEIRTNSALSIATKLSTEKHISEDRNNQTSYVYESWDDCLNYNLIDDKNVSIIPKAEAPAPALGEVYVPYGFTVSPGVQLGDSIELYIGDETRTLTVSGFIEDPQAGTPFVEVKRLIVSPEEFAQLENQLEQTSNPEGFNMFIANGLKQTEMNIFMTDAARNSGITPSDLTTMISEQTEWGENTSGMMSSTTLSGYAMMVVVIISIVIAVFAILLFVIALIICTHTISVSIEEHYSDYGTLKALGLPIKKLRHVLSIEYVGVSLAGLAVGFVISFAITPLCFPLFAALTGVLANNNTFPAATLLVLLALLLLVFAIVAFKTRKLGHISPLIAFRSGNQDVHFSSRASRPINGKRLNTQLAWRAIVSAKRQYVGVVICAFVVCAFMVLTIGTGSTLHSTDAAYDAFGIWKSDLSVDINADAPENVTVEAVEDAIEEVTPIETSWQEEFTMINLGGEGRAFVGLTDMSIVKGVAEGRAPKHTNEILVGGNLANDMGIIIGDELLLPGADGKDHKFIMVGRLSAMLNAGYGCIVTMDGMETLTDANIANNANTTNNTSKPTQYNLQNPDAADDVRALLKERFGDDVDTHPSSLFANTADMMDLIRQLFLVIGYSMDVIAAALVFLAVSLIIGRMFSAERHDLGVYRALGFSVDRLRLQFGLRFFMVALLGCALGATVAALSGNWLFGKLYGMFGVSEFAINTSPVMLTAITLGLTLVFFAAAYISSRKVKRVNVRELVSD